MRLRGWSQPFGIVERRAGDILPEAFESFDFHTAMHRLLVIFIATLVVFVNCQREQFTPEMSRYFMDEIRSNEYAPYRMKGADMKRKQFYAWAGKRSVPAYEKRKQFYAWAGK